MSEMKRRVQRMAGAHQIEADLMVFAAEAGIDIDSYTWEPSPDLTFRETFDLIIRSGAATADTIFSDEQLAEYQDPSRVSSAITRKILKALVKKLCETKRVNLHMASVYARISDAVPSARKRPH
jgi:hypothetical protein